MLRALLVSLISCTIAFAAESPGIINKIRTSTFDAGRLTRRFAADSATASTSPLVKNGRVEFFGPESEEVPTGVLAFDEAAYKNSDESASSEGTVTFTTAKGTASGKGFDSKIPEGTLRMHSGIRFESEKFILTGNHGEVVFTPKGASRDNLVKTVTLTGRSPPQLDLDRMFVPHGRLTLSNHDRIQLKKFALLGRPAGSNVVVLRKPDQKASFDRIESSSVVYDPIANKLLVKVPFTVWRNGDRHVTDLSRQAFAEFDLSK